MQCRSDPQSRASLYLAVSCGEECSGLTHFTEELFPVGERQGLGDGTRDPRAPEMGLIAPSGRRGSLGRFRILRLALL